VRLCENELLQNANLNHVFPLQNFHYFFEGLKVQIKNQANFENMENEGKYIKSRISRDISASQISNRPARWEAGCMRIDLSSQGLTHVE
jgi:hypothetical protein